MNYQEFIQKTNDIAQASRETKDEAIKEELRQEFYNVAIDYFNEHCTGDIDLADGETRFIPAIEN